MVALNQKLIMI